MPSKTRLVINSRLAVPLSELRFRFSRSGGPGGQKVNRTSTRVELLFDVRHAPSLVPRQRALILQRLRTYIDRNGVLHLSSQSTSSQWRNREELLRRFASLLAGSLIVTRKRIRTKPSRSAKENRLERKKRRSRAKQYRKSVKTSDWT